MGHLEALEDGLVARAEIQSELVGKEHRRLAKKGQSRDRRHKGWRFQVEKGASPNGLALQSNTWSDVLKRVLNSQNHGPIAAKPGASRLLII